MSEYLFIPVRRFRASIPNKIHTTRFNIHMETAALDWYSNGGFWMSPTKSLKLYEKDQTTGIPCSGHCKYGFSYKVITRIGFSIHCFESFYDSMRKNNFDLIGDIQSPSFKFQSIAAILYNIHHILYCRKKL